MFLPANLYETYRPVTFEGKGMTTRFSSYSATYNTARMTQEPFTLGEAVRAYFMILFAVAVFVLTFYYF